MERERVDGNKRSRVRSSNVGVPDIGGDWTLTDNRGRLVTSRDFLGQYQLVYFGFTYCPDICPEQLEKMKMVLERIEKEFGDVIRPIFVTVDPRRDSVAQVDAYVREFHPKLVGLTGTEVAKARRHLNN
eukprot:GHVT01023594.1.p2 GENE.GHVT01023594.1~~GHVT01023594.1.p2  ORF type:complete len:129 (+),score=27.95 GHVT01023594.1:177-563(+)